MNEDTVDVLIVGAGASGAAVAWSLAETRMRIVCLEQGGMPDPARYPSTGRDWEARQQDDFHLSPNVRQAPADYPINDENSPIKIVNYNGVGGGTVLFAGHFPRMHPSDFRVRSLDGVADDWPLDYDTLAPFYALNDKMMGVAGLAGDPAYPSGKAPVMPPLPLGRSGEVMARGFNKLGWHWWPSDAAIATEEYDGRPQCINLAACLAGCAQGAKGSADITYWPHALRAGVELRTGCRVREVILGADGMAKGVIYAGADGKEVRQDAHVVVLACNGVGTPRLLLNSTSTAFPDGLANSSGLVGKNLMLHPYGVIEGVFNETLDGHRGPTKSIWSHQFYETDRDRGFLRGYLIEAFRGRAPVATAMAGLEWGCIPWGEGHHLAFHAMNGRMTGMVTVCEDLPELHNCVTLDPELTDSDGIPAPRIDYRLSENSIRMLEHSLETSRQVLEAAGAREVFSSYPIAYGGWHLLGTARMGVDPETSVVNPWGRAHDVKNLFIVDGSLFVTSGGVNPTSTLQALALYVADQMKQRLATLFD